MCSSMSLWWFVAMPHSPRREKGLPSGSDRQRYLFVAFTIRRTLIRIIPVRDMNRTEQEIYGKLEETNS
jgi:uncharacterized DUF497 family protein